MIDNAVNSRWVRLPVRRLFNLRLAKWLAIGFLFALFYWHVVPQLVRDWYENETYSYGFLVPWIAVYLIWQRRNRLKFIAARPSLLALFPLSMAVVLALIGQAIGDVFSMRISMIFALASTIYLLLGREYFKALSFPLFYLMLMIPPPYVLIKDLTYHLRYLDAAHAANLLQLLGIPVFVEAYFIHLPNMKLEVADVCSGLSSVFALLALGTLYAYVLPIRPSLKVLLVACTFPFAMVANLIRIVVIAVLAYNFGAIVFQSTFHWLTGTTVFLLALAMLVSAGELLRRKFSLPIGRDAGKYQVATDVNSPDKSPLSNGLVHFFLCMFVLAGSVILSHSINNGHKMHFDSDLRLLVNFDPDRLVPSSSEDYYEDSNVDTALAVVAGGQDKKPVEIFIGYRGEQTRGSRLRSPKIHFPEHWNSVWLKPANIEVGGDIAIRGNWMLTRKGDSMRLVIYWYQVADDTFAGEFENRIRQLKRAILDRRTDGAVIRIATPVSNGDSIEEAQTRLGVVSVKLYPQLVKHWPQ
jgi:EpsI family protein